MYVVKEIHTHGQPRFSPKPAQYIAHKIALNTQEGTWLVAWKDVVHCTADSNYTRVCLQDGTALLISKTLARLEAALPARHFVRIHQSHLVNVDMIRCIGRDSVQLQSGTALPVSRQGRKTLMQAISTITTQI